MTTPPRRALWAGPGARRALAAGGPGIVEYALPPGGYVRFGDEWLLLRAALAAAPSPRCSPLGLAYLRWGQHGEPAARLLRAIRAGDVALARRRARGLRRWGATSGAAILWGFAAA